MSVTSRPSVMSRAEVEEITDILTAMSILEDMNINIGTLETLEELKMLLLSHLDSSTDCPNNEKDHRPLEETLREDCSRLTQLKELYSELEAFLKSNILEDSVKAELESYSPGYMDKLRMYMSLLDTHECPIVIAGETSAGKSTILNLLLGESLLPECVLHSTTTISHVRNGDSKSVTMVKADGSRVTHSLDGDTASSTQKLADCIGATPPREIFITWPIDILRVGGGARNALAFIFLSLIARS